MSGLMRKCPHNFHYKEKVENYLGDKLDEYYVFECSWCGERKGTSLINLRNIAFSYANAGNITKRHIAMVFEYYSMRGIDLGEIM